MSGPIERATDPTQLAVARVRARVLSGRGPHPDPEEQRRAQYFRDSLGALPAPIERELVALAAELIRTSPSGPILDRLRARFEQLYTHWAPEGVRVPSARLTPAWTAPDSAADSRRSATPPEERC
ncbi:hypothetical protein [Nocardia beijingensis]|uniref:hypothetical protein n=1 Tax=Nocardia beijingensis TaxID=95162 RepID=UPI00082DB65C|nr:hypothetical protein [Nocardia beijingensis]